VLKRGTSARRARARTTLDQVHSVIGAARLRRDSERKRRPRAALSVRRRSRYCCRRTPVATEYGTTRLRRVFVVSARTRSVRNAGSTSSICRRQSSSRRRAASYASASIKSIGAIKGLLTECPVIGSWAGVPPLSPLPSTKRQPGQTAFHVDSRPGPPARPSGCVGCAFVERPTAAPREKGEARRTRIARTARGRHAEEARASAASSEREQNVKRRRLSPRTRKTPEPTYTSTRAGGARSALSLGVSDRCSASIAPGSKMRAISRSRPPHLGQARTSQSKARRIRSAHLHARQLGWRSRRLSREGQCQRSRLL
jgi:hypothetical protein